MAKFVVTQARAREIILHAAGLSRRGQFGKGLEAAYQVIEHLGFLQVDTNYVVERAHHHALASRVPDYQLSWLDELQSDRRIFEFWTYASGFMPMSDFRFSLPVKASFLSRRKAITPTEAALMRKVLDRIGREGPLRARDFENDRVTKSAGWWDWRPSKVALERLHFDGRLASTRQPDFQKVYDLSENLIPPHIDLSHPTDEEYARYLIRRSLRALGIAFFKDIAFRGRYVKHSAKEELKKMIDLGEVLEVEVKGMKTSPLYMLAAYEKKKIKLTGEVFILSPFDILNVYRHRLKTFFDFDYQVECFVPEPKRKYGYFSLPILVGDQFVARMDSKADRKNGTLAVHNLHFESGKWSKAALIKVADAINQYATFNRCIAIEFKKTNQRTLLKVIRDRLTP